MSKIFFIGFNKTGTTTIHHLLLHNRIRSWHSHNWPRYSNLPVIARLVYARFDAFSDGEGSNFRTLKKMYPSALFVLNTREEGSWIKSRLRHAFEGNPMTPFGLDAIPAAKNEMRGRLAHDLAVGGRLAINKWVSNFRHYQADARQFFAGHPNFIELDVTAQSDWSIRLSHAAKRVGFDLNIDFGKPIWSNSSDQKLEWLGFQELVDFYAQTWGNKE